MNTIEVVNHNETEHIPSFQDLPKLASEVWTRDSEEFDLWHGPNGVIVNTAALEARKLYFEIIKQEV